MITMPDLSDDIESVTDIIGNSEVIRELTSLHNKPQSVCDHNRQRRMFNWPGRVHSLSARMLLYDLGV